MDKTPKEILTEARELLSDPKAWIKGRFAKNKHGRPVAPADSAAVCFCLEGAIRHVSPSGGRLAVARIEAKMALANAANVQYIPLFNDDPKTKHKDVLVILDKAIASLP